MDQFTDPLLKVVYADKSLSGAPQEILDAIAELLNEPVLTSHGDCVANTETGGPTHLDLVIDAPRSGRRYALSLVRDYTSGDGKYRVIAARIDGRLQDLSCLMGATVWLGGPAYDYLGGEHFKVTGVRYERDFVHVSLYGNFSHGLVVRASIPVRWDGSRIVLDSEGNYLEIVDWKSD